jgi:hypothetical protein
MLTVKITRNDEYPPSYGVITEGLSEEEAKQVIEYILWNRDMRKDGGDNTRAEIINIYKKVDGTGGLISAIKYCREVTGKGLREAKEQVEQILKEEGLRP